MAVSYKTILKVRREQFSKFGFSDTESRALARTDYKFTDTLLKQRLLRRNKKVWTILAADKTMSLDGAVRQAVMEDPLLEPTVKKEPKPKSGIVRLLRRLK